MNVWLGQLLVLRPDGVVYQLWHPVSHTDFLLADCTQELNASWTSGRTSSQARRSASSALIARSA
jgi:hypothetical protein